MSLAIDVRILDVSSPEARPMTGAPCRGCNVTLRDDEGDGWCRSCQGVVALWCALCSHVWSLSRVPELWPVCPECRKRDFVATTARAQIAVSPT